MVQPASHIPVTSVPGLPRRQMLATSLGLLGLPLTQFLQLRAEAKPEAIPAKAKSCILVYCWGGMSHIDSFDPKPNAPAEIRGPFQTIGTTTPGLRLSEHLPLLAQQSNRLAIVRSIHHQSSAHGKGMYWNMTGFSPVQPQVAANQTPSREDRPNLPAMISRFLRAPIGFPHAVQLPYPLVDNDTLQAGDNAGLLGRTADPIILRTPFGKPFGGVSQDLGAPVLTLDKETNTTRMEARRSLLQRFESSDTLISQKPDHFRQLAMDMLLNPRIRQAFDLSLESGKLREAYGNHIAGQSLLLARRLTEVGIPVVNVICAAGDLNGAVGDHWDTHGNNFNRLKDTMLPTFDKSVSALLDDLAVRGRLEETLVVALGDFGRTPKINGSAGRDHYPHAFSVVLAGGGIQGGQVYGSTDRLGAFPHHLPCGPNDLHATIFQALGIPLHSTLFDLLNRPHHLTDGKPLPLFG